MKYLTIVLLTLFISACQNGQKQLSESDIQNYLSLGDSISAQSQKVLLANVSREIADHGIEGAVNFCSEEAPKLTDSLSKAYLHTIQRLSDKNRNSHQALNNDLDKNAWSQIQKIFADSAIKTKHILMQENESVYYYKAIPLGMPTCLKCHGNVGTDIDSSTLAIIRQKYPEDLATGYNLGQLRGMWKVKLN